VRRTIVTLSPGARSRFHLRYTDSLEPDLRQLAFQLTCSFGDQSAT